MAALLFLDRLLANNNHIVEAAIHHNPALNGLDGLGAFHEHDYGVAVASAKPLGDNNRSKALDFC